MDLERRDDGDRLRVSDRERELVVEVLGQAAAEGRLTLDEYADRAAAAHSAVTRGELARLTEDLPNASPLPPPPAPRPATGAVSAYPDPGSDRLLAVFGDEVRKGSWTVPDRVEARAVFGDCRIDLQEARLRHPVTTIEANAIFGSVTIVVPEGMVEVRMSGTALFGDKRYKLREPAAPGAPVVEVRCNAVFGSVTVRPPRKSWWR